MASVTHQQINWRSRIVKTGKIRASQITPHPQNPRKHPQLQRDAVAASFDELGQIAPIIININNGYLVDGEERSWLALAQDDDVELDVNYVDLTEAEHLKALAYFDATGDLAYYDAELLDGLLREVNTDSPAIQQMLAELAADNGLYFGEQNEPPDDPGAQIDRASELLVKWQVARGDLWVIPSKMGKGEHRLLCGDSTNADDVARLLGVDKPALMDTDPPYGVSYDSAWRAKYSSGEYSVGSIQNDDRSDWTDVWKLWDTPILYVWHGGLHAHVVAESLISSGYELRGQIIWNKSVMVFGRGHYHWKHEPCWYAVKKGANANWQGDRSQHTVWDYGNGSGAGRTGDEADDFHANHISQKPVELMRRPIENHTLAGDVVADPFGGSGSTMVASEQLKRSCRMMEFEPKYCAVILERMAGMGLEPRRVEETKTP